MTDRVIGIAFTPRDQPEDPMQVADLVERFYEEAGLKPRTISTWGMRGKGSKRRYSVAALRAAVDDADAGTLTVWTEEPRDGPELTCYLRRDELYLEFDVRYVAFVSPRVPAAITEPVRALMKRFVDVYPMVHGAVAGYRSAAYASYECSFSGAISADRIDAETNARLGEDQMLRQATKRKPRRLYPVNVFSADIWAGLPPMPDMDFEPIIEDLGNCKMLTVWPELVEPRDPAFLAGTVELRRWLWPHTIQNPADEPERE